MRTLYLPKDDRRSPATKNLLDVTVQNTVRTDPESRMNALANLFVTERERLMGLFGRMDVRPWRGDVRVPGAVESAASFEAETDEEDLLYGVPDRWDIQHLRAYSLTPASTREEETGEPLFPEQFDRAVETSDGLVLQKGTSLWLLPTGTPTAEVLEEGRYGAFRPVAERFTLASITEERLQLYPARGSRRTEISGEFDGLEIVLHTGGRFEIELTYTRAVVVEENGVDLGDGSYQIYPAVFDEFKRLGRAIDSSGAPLPVREQPDGSVIVGGEGTLFYLAQFSRSVASPSGQRETRVSFAEIASHMYGYPRQENLHVWQLSDELLRAPSVGGAVPVDARGVVGELPLDHQIVAVLPSEHHLLVCGDRRVSLIEHAIGERRLVQDFSGLRLRGLTWTPEGHLALVTAREQRFDVWRILDIRDRQVGGLTPVRSMDS